MSISLTVKTLDSRNHNFDGLNPSMTVKELKEHISPVVGISAESQRLIYSGRVLQDNKQLSEYGVDQKVVHLVQRQPPVSTSAGADRLAASEARARSRGSSPSPRGGNGSARVYVHGSGVSVGQPSMVVRLNLAREMINRANAVLDRLENSRTDGATGPSSETNSDSNSSSSFFAEATPVSREASGSNANSASSQQPSVHVSIEGNTVGMPANISQIVQTALNSAMNTFASSGSGGVQTLSFHVGRDGQITSGGQTEGNGTSTDESQPNSSGTNSSATNVGQPRASNHPHPPAVAEVMRSYNELQQRLAPFCEELTTMLMDDENRSNTEDVERNQNFFSRVTEAMHFMSHALHAVSDAIINYNQAPPREVRARPFIIQSAMMQGVPVFGMGPRRGSFGAPPSAQSEPRRAPTAPSTHTSASSSSTSASPSSQSPPTVNPTPEIEVTMEPIVVGIEMGPEITINTSRSGGGIRHGGSTGGMPDAMIQNMIAGVLNNFIGGQVLSTQASSTPAPSTTSTQNSGAPSQDSRARGNTQTQPTTSTRTRTTTHVHYAPFGQISFPGVGPAPVGSSSFDPFLQCHSHHITGDRGRGLRIQRPQQRSSSVPPQANQQSSSGEQRPSNTSARSTPMQSPVHRRVTTATIDINMIPAFPRPSFARQPPQAQPQPQQMFEPGLANMLMQLAGNFEEARDPDMANMIQETLTQIIRAMSGRPGEGGQTIAEFLRTLPDYSHTEGESLLVDFLMSMASTLTFRDVINIVTGNHHGFARIQIPLRQFLQTRIMTSGVSLEAGLRRLIDENNSTFEEVARIAALRDDVDFAETLANFIEERFIEIARCVLECPQEEFSTRFYDLCRRFLSDLTNLSLYCCTDGPASLERMARNRLEAIGSNEDASGIMQEWTMSAAMGHVRTYLASHRSSDDELSSSTVRHYVISKDSSEAKKRKERRSKNETGSDTGSKGGSSAADNHQPMAEDNDTFVTPRSSPERMDMSENEQAASSNSSSTPVSPLMQVPQPVLENLPFPRELLTRGSIDSDVLVGSESWHRSLPTDWVPIIARDIQRQVAPQEQAPFSDAYLSTQPSKRRRLIAGDKPEGPVERVISETLQDAISAAGVEPTTSVSSVVKEASSSSAVVNAVTAETRKIAKARLDKDADFKEMSEKFPESKSFAKK